MPLTSYKINIKDLFLSNVLIGIYEHEKHQPQNLKLNIDVSLQIPDEYLQTQVEYAQVFCYHELIKKIEHHIRHAPHIGLLENLAADIAKLAFSNNMVQEISVNIAKPDAISNTDTVGIEMKFTANI